MAKPHLYAGLNPAVLTALRWDLLARGFDEPNRVTRPADLTAENVTGVPCIFVDGPDLRLQRVFQELDAIGASVPVIWIAPVAEQKAASPALLARASAVWDWPMLQAAWSLLSDTPGMTLPETRVTVPSGVGEDESERLGYVESSRHATVGTEKRFDRLALWLADYCGVDEAMVNLIGRHTKVNKGHTRRREIGAEMSKTQTICQFVVSGNQPVVVPDIAASAFCQDKSIAPGSYAGSYMGVPLNNKHDLALGSLCMMSAEPRPFTLNEYAVMNAVAQMAVEALASKTPDSGRMLVLGDSFRRLTEAILRHAVADDSLCLARVPVAAANAAWDKGLDFITLTDGWDCLVCLPRTTLAAAEARLGRLLTDLGIGEAPIVVVAQRGQTWGELRDSLKQPAGAH